MTYFSQGLRSPFCPHQALPGNVLVMKEMDDLRALVSVLHWIDQKREEIVRDRDEAMVHALGAGARVKDIQRIAGLSVRGAQLAVDRGRKIIEDKSIVP